MQNDKFLLVGQTVVPEEDLFTWARGFEESDRRVALWERGPVRVSTVFLGIDMNIANLLHPGLDEPYLFETAIFVSHALVWNDRCGTWLEAEAMHGEALRYLFGMWRRPLELAGWIHEGIEAWMRMCDRRFRSRYARGIFEA